MTCNELIVPEKCVVYSIPPEEDEPLTNEAGGTPQQTITLYGKEHQLQNIRNVCKGQTLMWLCPTTDGDKLVPAKIQHFMKNAVLSGDPLEPWALFVAVRELRQKRLEKQTLKTSQM